MSSVCMYVCMYVRMNVCMCVYVCMYGCVISVQTVAQILIIFGIQEFMRHSLELCKRLRIWGRVYNYGSPGTIKIWRTLSLTTN
jgi:hypothetical protein